MKISTKGVYALEALLYMGINYGCKPSNVKKVAEGTNISQAYLEQLFFALRKADILRTIRGPKGGYYIEPDLSGLTVSKIITAVEGPVAAVPCVLDQSSCTNVKRINCSTHHLWGMITSRINKVFNNVTLADLINTYNQLANEEPYKEAIL